ncbi:MAG: hypothetical protein U0235_24170 [Polyangiaceae bacterium]
MGKESVAPLLGEGLVAFKVRLRAKDVVFFKGVLDAHDGLCQVFAGGGDLVDVGLAWAQARSGCSTTSSPRWAACESM